MMRRGPKTRRALTCFVLARHIVGRSVALAALALVCLLLSSAHHHLAAQSIINQAPPAFDTKRKGLPLFGGVGKKQSAQPLHLQGDELIDDRKNDRVIARGNIEIFYNNHILNADEVIYDQKRNTLTAKGNVSLKLPDGSITQGESMTLTDDFRDGFIQSLSVVGKDNTRIAAARAIRRGGSVTEFERAKFTPCRSPPGKAPLWCLSARRIVHDQKAKTITYQDAAFNLFGYPILYMPYFQHADPTVKRKSGFLFPEFGSSSDLGFIVETPYYFALAPNYDFTFHPAYTSKQGILWKGEWRHRVAFGGIIGQYNLKLAGIDQDSGDLPNSIDPATRLNLDGWRGSVETHGRFSLGSWWHAGWDIIIESDDQFRRFYKLEKRLLTDRVNSAHVEGISDRNYFGAYLYHFGGLLLNDTPESESRVHPVVDYNYIVADPILGGQLSFNVNALSFSQDLTFVDANVVTQNVNSATARLSANVNWRRRIIDPIGQVFTPFAQLRGDFYDFRDVVDPTTNLLADNQTVTRGIATGGLLYSFPFVGRGRNSSHVIEPIAQVIARTESTNQRRLPNEDSRSLVLDDTNLFEIDRNSGLDRVETGTRINYGMQYTFQSHGGGFARFLAGQSYHVSGDNIYNLPGTAPGGTRSLFNPASGLETDRSDYVFAAYLAPISNFRALGQVRLDEDSFAIARADAFAQTSYGPLSFQATYAYTAANDALSLPTDQQSVLTSAGLRLTENWTLLGQLRYDIDAGERLQDAVGIQYADECFVLTATYSENFIDDPNAGIPKDKTFLVQLKFKHLGEYKFKTDVFDFGTSNTGTP